MGIFRGPSKAGSTSSNIVKLKNRLTSGELLNLARTNRLETSPLDIDNLIRALGIKIKRIPMGDEVSGSLKRTSDGWVISVNSLHHPRRQRFTLAHELAHFVLHKDGITEFKDTILFRNTETSPMERQANMFAAELLMPKAEFNAFVTGTSREIDDIAARFEVSPLAVKVRASELGYRVQGSQ